jgi:hypothetical protein
MSMHIYMTWCALPAANQQDYCSFSMVAQRTPPALLSICFCLLVFKQGQLFTSSGIPSIVECVIVFCPYYAL